MNYKDLKHKIKQEQKALARSIRNGKTGRRPINRCSKNTSDYEELESYRTKYRHQHIIYCNMFNNTPYKVIELPRDGNSPSPYYLDRIRKQWERLLEVICDCS